MAIELAAAAAHMAVATGCGALIGFERQLRGRKAGLRTNALVALGASAFVLFSQLVPNEVSPTRVAAQVVSGIGFLGAGIIFRDGLNVQGLTTAATLWCSAAVGLLAAIGAWPFAAVLTGFVVFVNFGLRPLVQAMKRRLGDGAAGRSYRLWLTCPAAAEAEMRAQMLLVLAPGGLRLGALTRTPAGESLQLEATILAEGLAEQVFDQAVQRLAAEPAVTALRWEAIDET